MATSHDMAVHHSAGLVLLSVVVALVAAYLALDLVQRSALAALPAARRRWLLLASGTMGTGIWSMHFVGMLALHLPVPMEYRPGLVALSMLAAVLGAGIALHVVTRHDARRASVVVGAVVMGLAVAAMHYIGMASMEMDAQVDWSLPFVAVSLGVAYGASLLALWLVFSMRDGRELWSVSRRTAAALAIALGVAGLHYTAMHAATFRTISGSHAHGGVNTTSIAALLGVAAGLMLVVLLFGANHDQQRGALANDLTAVARMMRDIGREGSARERICAAVCELTGATSAVLLEPTGTQLLVTASHGPGPANPDAAEAAAAFAEARRAFTPERADGAGSALYEPVMLDDRVVGVLVAGWPQRVRRLSDRATTIAGLLAAEAAFAIERDDMLVRLERLAGTDDLTGLPNRRSVDAELGRRLADAKRRGHALAVVMLDLDHFKEYNDRHGHQGGDRLLKSAAAAWKGVLRGADVAGRYGGEEFLVVLPDCTSEAAVLTADRLRTALPGRVTCSAGVAAWDGSETADALVARADAALYRAKDGGRDRTESATATSGKPSA
jgi:diguanylate cyclase (GGDEF)-like protein